MGYQDKQNKRNTSIKLSPDDRDLQIELTTDSRGNQNLSLADGYNTIFYSISPFECWDDEGLGYRRRYLEIRLVGKELREADLKLATNRKEGGSER